MCPCLSVGVCDVSCNVLVESVYVWVGGVCGAELIALSDQADGGVREVGDTPAFV